MAWQWSLVSSSESDLFPVSLCAEILQPRSSLIHNFLSFFSFFFFFFFLFFSFFFLQASGMLMLFYPDWRSGLSLPAATSVPGFNAITELSCLTYDRRELSNKQCSFSQLLFHLCIFIPLWFKGIQAIIAALPILCIPFYPSTMNSTV